MQFGLPELPMRVRPSTLFGFLHKMYLSARDSDNLALASFERVIVDGVETVETVPSCVEV